MAPRLRPLFWFFAGELLPSSFDAGVCSRSRGLLGCLVAAEANQECRCGDRDCMCDLASAGEELGTVMTPLGYDTCVDDGLCEGCLGAEAELAYCKPTRQRQRVVCAGCSAPDPPLPFCLPGFQIYWQTNDTEAFVLKARRAQSKNATKHAASAGIFYRSCGAGAKPRPQRFLQRGRPGHNAKAVAEELSKVVDLAKSGAGEAPLPKTTTRPAQDESEQLFIFLAFNAIVLGMSAYSLRRQQQKLVEQTLDTLKSHVSGLVPNGAGPASKSTSPGKPCSPRDATSGTTSKRGSGKLQGSGMDVAAKPDILGRPAESKPDIGRTISAAAIRAGNAIEMAVTGDGSCAKRK